MLEPHQNLPAFPEAFARLHRHVIGEPLSSRAVRLLRIASRLSSGAHRHDEIENFLVFHGTPPRDKKTCDASSR